MTDDGGAYGTYMGGPDLPGPCTYTDGSTRIGNGFGGSPGELVRLDENGRTVSEAPATPETPETEQRCDNIPALPQPTCANPHGVQAREDLDTLVTSDYNEPRNIILNPVSSPSSYLRRPTVRTWDISDKDHPKLKAVSFLPDGPRVGKVPHHEEPRAAMETTVTNLPEHKGAFASTMQGGAIYYAPDITAEKPEWREVFDLTTSNKATNPASSYYGGGSNGGWLQTSLDDKYLYHAVVGRPASGDDPGSPPYILKLDIQQLLGVRRRPAVQHRHAGRGHGRRRGVRLPGDRRHPPGTAAAPTGARWTTWSSARTARTRRRRTWSAWRTPTTSSPGPASTVTTGSAWRTTTSDGTHVAGRGVPGRADGRGVPRLRPRDLAARRVGSGQAALHALRHRGRRHPLMPTAAPDHTHGRDRQPRSRLWAASVAATALVAATGYAVATGEPDSTRDGVTLARDWAARANGQQVLGGERSPGVPSVQRMKHDRTTFTVTVAPARPGRNLVRVDASRAGEPRSTEGRRCWSGPARARSSRRVPGPGRTACSPSSTCPRAPAPCW